MFLWAAELQEPISKAMDKTAKHLLLQITVVTMFKTYLFDGIIKY